MKDRLERAVVILVTFCLTLTACSSPQSAADPPPDPTPTPTFASLLSESRLVSYDDLFRNNASHVGQTVHYQGEIIQVLEGGKDFYAIRANVTKGQYIWTDTVYLDYTGPRVLEKDILDFIGTVKGLKSYESVMKSTITIPEINVIQAKVSIKAGDRK